MAKRKVDLERAYADLQGACGIEEGDKVKVLFQPQGHVNGWDMAPPPVDPTVVGKVFTVNCVDGCAGVELDNWYWYPFYALEVVQKVIAVELNDSYTATVDVDAQKVMVGCQEIPFSKVIELADKVRPLVKEKVKEKEKEKAPKKATLKRKR